MVYERIRRRTARPWDATAVRPVDQLALAATASASGIHEPANGLTVPQTAIVRFDWFWADDQYASAIYFSLNPDPSLEVWRQAEKTGMQYDSNLTIDFGHWTTLNNGEWFNGWAYPFPDGVWYWRLCSKSIFGEDDKCYLESEIRTISFTDATPPPPPAACADGVDNDGDGVIALDGDDLVHREKYAYYLVVDDQEIGGYERDPFHDPPEHRHCGVHEPGGEPWPSVAFKDAVEDAWDWLSKNPPWPPESGENGAGGEPETE
jgi:hypothetical protein